MSSEPFDPNDPFQVAVEMFRIEVMRVYLDASKKSEAFQSLDDLGKMNAFVGGAMTAVCAIPICGTIGPVKPMHVIGPIAASLPHYFQQALSVVEAARATGGKLH